MSEGDNIPRKADWNRWCDEGMSFHGWRLSGVLLNLLRPEGMPELTSWPWDKRQTDWNEYFDDPEMGPKLLKLLQDATRAECDQCWVGGDCIHNAARAIEGLRRVVEHPPDCPECARIARERKAQEDGIENQEGETDLQPV